MKGRAMDWLPFAIGAAVALAAADFSVKLAAGKISSELGALIYSLTTLPIMALWVIAARANGSTLQVTTAGLAPALMTGVAFAFVTIFLYQTFSTGVNISLAIPLIRISGILVASALGIVILGEPLTWRYVAGVALAVAGIYLIVTR